MRLVGAPRNEPTRIPFVRDRPPAWLVAETDRVSKLLYGPGHAGSCSELGPRELSDIVAAVLGRLSFAASRRSRFRTRPVKFGTSRRAEGVLAARATFLRAFLRAFLPCAPTKHVRNRGGPAGAPCFRSKEREVAESKRIGEIPKKGTHVRKAAAGWCRIINIARRLNNKSRREIARGVGEKARRQVNGGARPVAGGWWPLQNRPSFLDADSGVGAEGRIVAAAAAAAAEEEERTEGRRRKRPSSLALWLLGDVARTRAREGASGSVSSGGKLFADFALKHYAR
ncbi:hypothetical protein KM043_010517 [Ampulex compressa]|nr:hypothetical protein KM043_010517 [Ampulex compressa]